MIGTTRRLIAGSMVIGLLASMSATPTAAARPVTMYIQVGGSCISGRAPNFAKLKLLWSDGSGDKKGAASFAADEYGNWDRCFDSTIETDDTIKITKGTTSRTLKVPRLTAVANRVTDVVRGRGPVGASLDIGVYGENDGTGVQETVAGDGTYLHDFSGDLDFIGCDTVEVTSTTPPGDQVVRRVGVPCVEVAVGRWIYYGQVWGSTRPLGEAKIVLRTGADELKAIAYAGGSPESGYFSGYFGDDDDGDLVRALPGDKVDSTGIASDASFTIPPMSIVTNLTTDVVTGTCLPSRPYTLEAWSPNYSRSAYLQGTANGSGQFTKDLTSDMDLRLGDYVQVTCRFASGDAVAKVAQAK